MEIGGITDPKTRLEVILRRMEFDENPAVFANKWEESEQKLSRKIRTAQQLLPSFVIPEAMLKMIVQICVDAGVDGHRGDITMMKTAKTLAACNGKTKVGEEEVRDVALLVLSHRVKKHRSPMTSSTKTPFKNPSKSRGNNSRTRTRRNVLKPQTIPRKNRTDLRQPSLLHPPLSHQILGNNPAAED